MDATKGNGLDAANDQPAKTHTKDTLDFIVSKPLIGTFPTRHNTVRVVSEHYAQACALVREEWNNYDSNVAS